MQQCGALHDVSLHSTMFDILYSSRCKHAMQVCRVCENDLSCTSMLAPLDWSRQHPRNDMSAGRSIAQNKLCISVKLDLDTSGSKPADAQLLAPSFSVVAAVLVGGGP